MINLDIQKKYQNVVSGEIIEKNVSDIIRLLELEPQMDISIFLGSDSILRKLNKRYRGFDEPTDVLSFESGQYNPETGNHHIGDIVISVPTAERQAFEADHPLMNELILLLIHAILHLNGFNHNTRKEKNVMWEKQQYLLNKMNIKINRISGDEDFHD